MKTSIKTLTLVCALFISLSTIAQHRTRGNQPQQQNQNNKQIWASNNNYGGGNWHENVTIHMGGYPYNYGSNYGYYNNNSYNIKKAARNSIRQSAQVIVQALQFSDWNDVYSPWLAKAIRHQQYAKQLYFWGDYSGALNHAERAGFLGWSTLSYFNNSYGYDDGFAGNNYPNPYTDPNNPYYRKNNTGTQQNNTTIPDDNFGYRKGSPEKTPENETSTKSSQKMEKTALDGSLPQNKLNDKELLKMDAKDLDIE
jgi:hypothetical protein